MSTPAHELDALLSDVPSARRRQGAQRLPAYRSPAPPTPSVDPRLDSFVNDVMAEASRRTGYTYKLGEGSRTPEQQAGKVARGVSWTYDSPHMHGRGRDVLAFDAQGNYITDGAHPAYKALGDVYGERAASAPAPVKWGVVKDGRQVDPGHFQLSDDAPEPHELDSLLSDVPAKSPLDDLLADVPPVADGYGEPVSINATPSASASPSLPALRSSTLDVQTMEGRAQRDAGRAIEADPNARRWIDVKMPAGVRDWSSLSSNDVAQAGARQWATERGIPSAFTDEWLKTHGRGLHIYDLATGKPLETGVAMGREDIYDLGKRTFRLSAEMPELHKLEEDYKASRGLARRAADWATDSLTSPGEKVLDVAGAVARPVAKGAGYVARPFQATSAGVFAGLRGENPLTEFGHTLATGETTAKGANPIGNFLRDSQTLNNINPRLGRLLGAGADMVFDPSNLVALGVMGKGARLVAAGGRAAEEVGALGRTLGFLERGMVEARPLGLEAAAATATDTAALEDRLARVLEVTRKLKAGEPLTPEDVALHAEVKAAAAAKPSAAVEGEMIRYARKRADYYRQQAAGARGRTARANAQALADEYAAEAERLSAPGGTPSPEQPGIGQMLTEDALRRKARQHGVSFDEARAQAVRQGYMIETVEPGVSLPRRAGRAVVDVVQLPKVKAGFDLSATGRQGLAQILAHPTYFKEAMTEQVKAFASEDAFNSFVEGIRSHPDFDLLRKHVDLSSVGDIREEPFASGLARKIPGVRASDRAYSAALDSVRVQAWDNYVASVAENPNVTDDTYKAIGELVNISTGRGVVPVLDRTALGRKFVNALNVPFFSPRNTASKFNLISPVRVVKNALNPATRPVAYLQMRDAVRGLGTLGTTLGLAHVAGLDVGLNPFHNDFGKLRVGHAVYDLTGGESATTRYVAQMGRSFYSAARGKALPKGHAPTDLTLHYLRSQLQPAAGVVADWKAGKTFEGKAFTYSGAAADLVVPFVVDDMYKGWLDAGGSSVGDVLAGKDFKPAVGGAARCVPGVFGVGVNFYEKKPVVAVIALVAGLNRRKTRSLFARHPARQRTPCLLPPVNLMSCFATFPPATRDPKTLWDGP
jgi:hypothetical protein